MGRGPMTAVALAALVLAVSAALTTASVARSQILPDAFEPDDSPDAARTLDLDGVPQRHSIHVPGDRDWVRFVVAPGARIRLSTTGACDPVLTLFAPNGVVVLLEDDDSGGGSNASMEVVLSEGGTYFARVRAYAEAETCESYDLVGALPGVAIAQTPAPSPTPAAQNTPAPVATLPPTAATRLPTGTPTPAPAAVIPTETVAPLAEAVLPSDTPAPTMEAVLPSNTPAPTPDPVSAETPALAAVPTLLEDSYESDDTPDQAGTLPLTGAAQSRTFHSASDVDWIWLPLELADVLVILTTGACDTHMTLYGPDAATTLTDSDDGAEEANAALIYSVRTAGTYFVRVRLFPGRDPCDAYELIGFVSRAAAPTPVVVPTEPVSTTPTPVPTAIPTPAAPANTATPTITPAPVRFFTTPTPTSPVGL